MRVIYMDGHFIADGEPMDCAMWTFAIEAAAKELNEKHERDLAKKDVDNISNWLSMSLKEMIREEGMIKTEEDDDEK